MSYSNLLQQNNTLRTLQITSKRLINSLIHQSPQKVNKLTRSQVIENKQSSSFDQSQSINYLRKSKNLSLIKRKNSHSNYAEGYAPSQAKNINQLVKKKHRLLAIKHRIKNESEEIPNILEIKDSVNKSQISFLRRMDVKLNASKHANLLPNLKSDLQIKSRDYLKQGNSKSKSRRYLLKEESRQQAKILDYKPYK